MLQNNTLFIIAKYGLYPADEKGIFKSLMWILTPEEKSMKYVSFHKEKSSRAYKGGKIVRDLCTNPRYSTKNVIISL